MCQAIPHLEQLITGGVEKGVRHCRFQMLAGGDGVPYRQGWVSPSVIAIISPRDATACQLTADRLPSSDSTAISSSWTQRAPSASCAATPAWRSAAAASNGTRPW